MGDACAEALWEAHKHINESADFVMYWWDRAAEFLTAKGTALRRFGLVTTNSITQEFSRRVMKNRIDAKQPISILMAIPDHPWTKVTPDAAAVRIAMTVGKAGKNDGLLREVVSESALDTDQPQIEFTERVGRINPDLTIGANAASVLSLRANEGLCSRGMAMHGAGFIVTAKEAIALGLGKRKELDRYIRPYRHGRDLVQTARKLLVIDLDGLTIEDVRAKYPEVYQHVLATVKPERDKNNEESRRLNWWLFGRRNTIYRSFKDGLSRYIGTAETSKHRIFIFLPGEILADNMVVNIGSDDAYVLGVLSTRIHIIWALRLGGWLGMGNDPRYSKSKVFDPFPFPSPSELLKDQIRTAADELDSFRKERQKQHPSLTLTQMYNVLEKLRAKAPLDQDDERIKGEGLILILRELHDKIERLVFQAYGWPETLTDEQILEKLVALNHERAAEERRGHVRWLRPEYQIPRFGKDVDKMAAKEEGAQIAADLGLPTPAARKLAFPADAVEQTAAVFAALAAAGGPISAAHIAQDFRKTKNLEETIAKVLSSLARLGHVSTKDGRSFAIKHVA